MKNICFLIGNLNNSGGTERVTSLIVNKLSKLGYNVSILSIIDGSDPFFDLNNNIKVSSLYAKKISFKRSLPSTILKIRNFVKKQNIDTLVVVDSISCIFTIPALYGLKVNHICWEHFNFNVDLGVKYRRIGRKWAARYCDYIVTLTSRDKELWEKGLRKVKAKIVPISNPSPYERGNNRPSLDYKTVLSIGRLTPQKGFDLLIAAWAELGEGISNWNLKIVGDGEDEAKLKDLAKFKGVSNSVHFIPSTKDVEHYYKTSSFYCLSSRYEGLPMVLLEAQAFGLPIVAFNCDTGPSEVITDAVNGYICKPNNIENLAESLRKMILSEPENYSQMFNNSLTNSERYKLEEVIKKWVTIL